MDSYVIPGISALARDMASDSNCVEYEIASTETLVSRLAAEGRPYVVVPHFTGIYFCSSLMNPTKGIKVRVTVARFEGIGKSLKRHRMVGTCGTETRGLFNEKGMFSTCPSKNG